jgi:hypothetical protein
MAADQHDSVTGNALAAAAFLAQAINGASLAAHAGRDELETVRGDFAQHVSCAQAHFEAAIEERLRAGKSS